MVSHGKDELYAVQFAIHWWATKKGLTVVRTPTVDRRPVHLCFEAKYAQLAGYGSIITLSLSTLKF